MKRDNNVTHQPARALLRQHAAARSRQGHLLLQRGIALLLPLQEHLAGLRGHTTLQIGAVLGCALGVAAL
mgnify:CR=1 FL=1